MLATFMGYFYTMKSELDAMVVVIGIQKRRSLLGTDDSERGTTAPPQLLSSASVRKDPGARNRPQDLDGTEGQGLLRAATLNASTHSSNGRSLSSLPLAVHSVSRPVENRTVQLQNPLERSRPTGHPSPSRVSRNDLERAAGVITALGGKEIGESRQSSLISSRITAFTNTDASGYPTYNGRHHAVVPADPSISGVQMAKSPPSGESSAHREGVSGKQSKNEERSATPSSRRPKNRGEVSSRSSSCHTRGPPLPRGRPIAAHQ
ncbi:hypothetical protein HPB50_018226 [Hyalomma asiaticum]|uniref:Uncharacterized protein n=1 Tax=Hyalomma asiaticum TaxID=266040 RepID=A0ACB7SPF0_HYAAI|nr:hypothetical protein HPB50_018226 [Hyalomma asiaticum]